MSVQINQAQSLCLHEKTRNQRLFFFMQLLHILWQRRRFEMLCAACGEKVQFMEGVFICKMCDSEYDILDTDEHLIPEPIFVNIRLHSQYAIKEGSKVNSRSYEDSEQGMQQSLATPTNIMDKLKES